MSDGETAEPIHAQGNPVALFPARQAQPQRISFDRHELREIFNVYGRKVAAGEWRDYAMDFGFDAAVFSIFRRTSETPLYRIVKDPGLRNRQGLYAVIAATGLILKRGSDLAQVLRVLDKQLKVVAG